MTPRSRRPGFGQIDPGDGYYIKVKTEIDARFLLEALELLTDAFEYPFFHTQVKLFDVYNVMNASSVLVTNTRFGPAWRDVQQIPPGRLFKFGMQLEF